MKSAGDAYVTAVESFNAQNPGLTGTYMDSKSAKAEKRARINLLDLKEQGVGEAHVFFKSNIVRANLFFMDPGPAKAMRLNVMMKVEIPKDEVLYTLVKSIEDFEQLINTRGIPEISAEQDEALEQIVESISKQSHMLDAIDRGINVLFDIHKQLVSKDDITTTIDHQEGPTKEMPQATTADVTSQSSPVSEDTVMPDKALTEEADTTATADQVTDQERDKLITITTRVMLTESEKSHLGVAEDFEQFELPLVDKAKFKHQSAYIMRAIGRSKDEADKEVQSAGNTIENVTAYRELELVSQEVLLQQMAAVIQQLTT